MTAASPVAMLLRFGALYVSFLVCFLAGSIAVAGALPDAAASEPGVVPPAAGLLIIALVNVAVVAALIVTSRWHGWKLALSLALAYYGAVTFMTQIETWYFLSSLTVDRRLLSRLFLMGIPPAFVFVPLAVWLLGKWRVNAEMPQPGAPALPARQWIWRLAVIALVYVALYWLAGYFIAWQNPELRAFYGQPGDPLPFFTHTATTLRRDPDLFLFQLLRGVLWVMCALPVIHGSRVSTGLTALLVALLFSAPQNVGHLLANPLMPAASVRWSHMIETAASTFVFGLIVVWLLRHAGPAKRRSSRPDSERSEELPGP